MAPTNNNEILQQPPTTSESLKVGAIPETFEVPQKEERFLIGAEKGENEGEDPKGGFEVVSLADCARDEKGIITYEYSTQDEQGNARTESVKLNGNTVALLVKNGEAPDFATGKGFKGLREGELVTDEVISKRFGETTSPFSVGITEGKIIVENTRPEAGLNVMTTKETTVEAATEAPAPVIELEVSAERAEVANELGGEALDSIGVNEPNDEIDVETKPRSTIAEMMSGEAEPAPEAVAEVAAEASEQAVVTPEQPAVEAVVETSEQATVEEATSEVHTAEEAVAEATPEAPAVESELGTATEELEVFEAKMGETKTVLEQLIGGQYDSFKDINKALDGAFEDKTGQQADLPSLLRMNVAKLSTYIREIDAGQGDVNTLREVANILGSVRQATGHFQGGNSPLVIGQQLVEASTAKAHSLGEGMEDATHSLSQSIGRITEAVNSDTAASAEPGQYDVAMSQSRHDIMSLVSDIEDNDGPIVGARRVASTIGNDLYTAQAQYYTMSGLVDNVLGQIGSRGVDTNDLHDISRMIAQFEDTFEQLEQSKRALSGFIPQTPEQ